MFGVYTKAIVTAMVYLIGVVVSGFLFGTWDKQELYIGIMGLANVLLVWALANAPERGGNPDPRA